MRRPMMALLMLVASPSFIAGGGDSCKWVKVESGKAWCNQRYLYPEMRIFDSKHLNVAKRGYLYVLAAALVMQSPDEVCHRFGVPKRLVEVTPRPEPTASGFKATTFEILSRDNPGEIEEIVVAFAGTDQVRDLRADFLVSRRQYDEATDYTAAVAKRYPGRRLVAAGFSLGGGLAVHVAKNERTRALVAESWALNPSPVDHAPDGLDSRIWLVAADREALKVFRRTALGAPESQRAEGFGLIKSKSIYAHFRWVLARTVLFAADVALQDPNDSSKSTEPLEILQSSRFAACRAGNE